LVETIVVVVVAAAVVGRPKLVVVAVVVKMADLEISYQTVNYCHLAKGVKGLETD
jgi:hypothetical protein